MNKEKVEDLKVEEAALAAHKKGMILVKSTVIALFVILVVLMIAFILVKNKKDKTASLQVISCRENKSIVLNSDIEKLEIQGNYINVLTKFDPKNKSKEFIKIDANCGNEISRIKFEIK
ncbi:MAG: hypothetical protein FJ368_04250 [Pelagibacterales bacterium]|nr:hypothetical protein [Pelagibacterales bacterium]